MKVYARERYFVRADKLGPSLCKKIIDHYTTHFFEEKACAKCEWNSLRAQYGLPGECEACAAYKYSTKLANKVVVGKHKYIACPLGDYQGLCKLIRSKGDIQLVEKHPIIPIKKIKFTGELRPYQKEAVEACIKGQKGVLQSDPRTGKTVMLTAIIAKLSVKSLIIASQRDWLVGFYETFVGSETQKGFTDIDNDRIGFCKKLEDFERFDVCLATVQTFHSENGQKLLRKLRDKFTLVGIDEVHTSSANRYIQEISRFNCKYKIGLTGTPDRKDGKYPLTEKVVGPILYHSKTERLRPAIRLVRTKYNRVMKSGVWSYIVRNMENDKDRQKLIAQYAIQDMKNGHMVLIPFTQVKPILSVVKLINDMYGSQVAYPFYGGLRKDVRDKTIEDARNYKVKIIVGNMRLLGTGINIGRASAIYQSTLSSNIPQATQRISRVLTPYDGKPQPILRLFLDDTSVARACLNNEWWNCIRPVFKPIISEKDEQILYSYLKDRKRSFEVDL